MNTLDVTVHHMIYPVVEDSIYEHALTILLNIYLPGTSFSFDFCWCFHLQLHKTMV